MQCSQNFQANCGKICVDIMVCCPASSAQQQTSRLESLRRVCKNRGGGGISPVLYPYDTWYGVGGWVTKPLQIQLVETGYFSSNYLISFNLEGHG